MCVAGGGLRFLPIYYSISTMHEMISLFIDFIRMTTSLGLFYAERLGNCVRLYLQFLLKFFFFFGTRVYEIKYSYRIQIICKQIYLTHRWNHDRYHRSGSEWTWECHNQDTLFFWWGWGLTHVWGYNKRILSLVVRANVYSRKIIF